MKISVIIWKHEPEEGYKNAQWLTEDDYERIYVVYTLAVVKDNIPAERLYQKCGYQLIGTVSLGYEAYGLPWYHL